MNASTRRAGYAALAVVSILAAGAACYWRERMLFADAPWVTFQILNRGRLFIVEQRYGSFITQAFPLLGSWLHLPLRTILILYSVSFPLFHGVVTLLLLRWKQHGLAVLLAFYLTLTISAGYYWTNNEVHQGVGWMMLAFGVMLRSHAAAWRPVPAYALALGLLFLALFSHPLLILTTGALWLTLLLLGSKALRGARGLGLAIPALAFAGLRIWTSVRVETGYDHDKLLFLQHFELRALYRAFEKPVSKDFLERCWTHYYVFTALFIWGLWALIRERRWGLLGWTLLATAGLWGAICLTFDNFTVWYLESDWASLTLVGAAPFVFCALPRLRPAPVLLVLATVFAIRLTQIRQCAAPFEARVALLQRQLDDQRRTGLHKIAVVVPDDRVFDEKLLISWGLPVELLMLSSLEGRTPQCTAVCLPDTALVPEDPRIFRTAWSALPPADLNQRYFNPDTSGPYRILSRSGTQL